VGGCVIQQNPPPAYLPWASKGQHPTFYSPNQNPIWRGVWWNVTRLSELSLGEKGKIK